LAYVYATWRAAIRVARAAMLSSDVCRVPPTRDAHRDLTDTEVPVEVVVAATKDEEGGDAMAEH
jgi:hypothetical protein